jgi:hypothetical protein
VTSDHCRLRSAVALSSSTKVPSLNQKQVFPPQAYFNFPAVASIRGESLFSAFLSVIKPRLHLNQVSALTLPAASRCNLIINLLLICTPICCRNKSPHSLWILTWTIPPNTEPPSLSEALFSVWYGVPLVRKGYRGVLFMFAETCFTRCKSKLEHHGKQRWEEFPPEEVVQTSASSINKAN